MTVWIKLGALGDLSRPMLRAQGLLEARFGTVYVNSIREWAPGRKGWSLHWRGDAFDVSFKEDEIGATKAEVVEALPDGYDVVEYATSFHIEWDPKEG